MDDTGDCEATQPERDNVDCESTNGERASSRRNFLKTVAVIAAGAVAAGGAVEEAEADVRLNTSVGNFIDSHNVSDLRAVRLPGVTKSFEEMTIAELTRLRRPGSAQQSYSFNITCVSSDVTISSASRFTDFARARGAEAVEQYIKRSPEPRETPAPRRDQRVPEPQGTPTPRRSNRVPKPDRPDTKDP